MDNDGRYTIQWAVKDLRLKADQRKHGRIYDLRNAT